MDKHLISLATLYGLSFIIGLFVTYRGLPVHYARKILCICFFLISSYILAKFNSAHSLSYYQNLLIGSLLPLLWIFSFLEPLRDRVAFLRICFSSFDRPEDRPHTILWLSSGILIGYWVLFAMIEWLRIYDAAHLIFITVFISTLGDGMAEPIGVRYGKLKYKTNALFTNKTYHRTIEGSACVFLSAISVIVAYHAHFTPPQFLAMLLLMPIAMTVTEAKSPHTWDNPFMHLIGGLITIIVIQI